MKVFKKTILPILFATIWISVSEFIRNELIFKFKWIDHYKDMGLDFPDDPINGAIWGLWSLLFAMAIYIISQKFSLIQTTFLSWYIGFVLMWVVIGNMGVLPYSILAGAIPLSLLEAFVASLIIIRMATPPGAR